MNPAKLLKLYHDAEALARAIRAAGYDFATDKNLRQAAKDEKLRKDLVGIKARAMQLVHDLETS